MRWSVRRLEQHQASRTDAAEEPAPRRRPRKPRPKRAEPSELQVHISVAGHLLHRGVPGLWWFHPANGELRDDRTAAKLKAMGVRAGVPDLVQLHRRRLFALELKRHDGRLSPEQQAARDRGGRRLLGVRARCRRRTRDPVGVGASRHRQFPEDSMSDNTIECAFQGRVGTAPTMRTSKTGKPWANFSVAVGAESDTQWVSVSVFGDRAQEVAGLEKGAKVYVEGRLRLNVWTGQDGRERSGLQVAATLVQPMNQIGNRRSKPQAPAQRESQQSRESQHGPFAAARRDWQAPPAPNTERNPNLAADYDGVPFERFARHKGESNAHADAD